MVELTSFVDTDWSNDIRDLRAISGNVFQLGLNTYYRRFTRSASVYQHPMLNT
jgi:hypothetical protein